MDEHLSPFPLPRLRRPVVVAAAALGSLALVAAVDGWRVGLLTAVAAGCLLATRLRIALPIATAFVVLVAALVLTGHGVGASERAAGQAADEPQRRADR